jgi:hypothetical protein
MTILLKDSIWAQAGEGQGHISGRSRPSAFGQRLDARGAICSGGLLQEVQQVKTYGRYDRVVWLVHHAKRAHQAIPQIVQAFWRFVTW